MNKYRSEHPNSKEVRYYKFHTRESFKKTILLLFISVFMFLSCSTSNNYHLILVEDFVKDDNLIISNYFTCNDSICYNSGVFCNRPLDVVFDKVDIKRNEITINGIVRDENGEKIPYYSVKKGEFNTNRDSIRLSEGISFSNTSGRFELKLHLVDKTCVVFYSHGGYFARIYELRNN